MRRTPDRISQLSEADKQIIMLTYDTEYLLARNDFLKETSEKLTKTSIKYSKQIGDVFIQAEKEANWLKEKKAVAENEIIKTICEDYKKWQTQTAKN